MKTSWIGKKISFEGPKGEGSHIGWGIVTKETQRRLFVKSKKLGDQWIDKIEIYQP